MRPETSACFSDLSTPVRSAPNSNRPGAILSATFLPPIEEVAAYIPRPRHCPRPKPRWAVRRCTFSTPATMATAALTSSSLRRTARRGRQTLKPQADFRDCLSLHKLCDTPLCCLLQAPCAPSPSFTSVPRHIVITAHRHIQPLDLISVSASRESGAVVCVPIRERNFHAHGSDFTAQWGVGSAYSEGARGGEGKTSVSAVGGVQSPYGGKPPKPPNVCCTAVLHRQPTTNWKIS